MWKLDGELFVCEHCEAAAGAKLLLPPPSSSSAAQPKYRAKKMEGAALAALRSRQASDLPRCSMAAAIEDFLSKEIESAGVVLPSPVVIRVVSRKDYLFPALKEFKQRYGEKYPHEFPYSSQVPLHSHALNRPRNLIASPPSTSLSQVLLAFQSVGGQGVSPRDVCLFAMYVQEYDESCPQPNTNRVYISYVASRLPSPSIPFHRLHPRPSPSIPFHSLPSPSIPFHPLPPPLCQVRRFGALPAVAAGGRAHHALPRDHQRLP